MSKGYDINQRRGQESPFGKALVDLHKNSDQPELAAKYRKRLGFLLQNGLNPNLKEKWGRDAFFNLRRYPKTEEEKELAVKIELEYKPVEEIKDDSSLPAKPTKPWWRFWN